MTEPARFELKVVEPAGLEEGLEFGPFRLLVKQRMLLEDGRPQRLGGRALDLLILLASRPGELLTKEQLIDHAWPNISVEESSLRVHIAALRRVLRDGRDGTRYIVNVMGRGYCFTTSVHTVNEEPAPRPEGREGQLSLPSRLARIVGRDEVVRSVAAQLQAHRFVTIVGFGGVGKTTVALAAAEHLSGWYPDGIFFVDLAALAKPELVPASLGSTLGLSVPFEDPMPAIVRHLSNRRILLLLDNCEHVLDTVAGLAEQILRAAPQVHVLATSREPLRAEGERLQHLSPLDLPPAWSQLTAKTALQYPAVELFVEHACASQDSFQVNDADALVVADICRRLDGIPLAIELAANRVDLFGLRGLARRLDDRFLLETQGRRTALSRHRTLMAMLDWSYELLSPVHQTVFRRLATLRSAFTLEAAITIARDDVIDEHDVIDAVTVLSSGSLLATDISGEVAFYSLLGVTRAYAQLKMDALEDVGQLRRRHAVYLLDLFIVASREWLVLNRTDWLAIYGRTVDDVRAALDWAFAPEGDPTLGIKLTAAWMTLGTSMSLIEEFSARVATAIHWLETIGMQDPVVEMQLRAGLSNICGQTRGEHDSIEREAAKVTALAELSSDPAHRHDALLGMWVACFGIGNYKSASIYSSRLRESAIQYGDRMARLTAERMTAQNHHFLGEHRPAEEMAVHVMNAPVGALRMPLNSPAQVDRRVSMRIVLARCAYIQGRWSEAAEIADESVDLAQKDLVHSLCQALGMAAIPIALWHGRHERAAALCETLVDHSGRFALDYWRSWGLHYLDVLRTRGDLMTADYDAKVLQAPGVKLLDHLITCGPGYSSSDALSRVRAGEVGWCAPEILRTAGEAALTQAAGGDREQAGSLLRQALRVARQQKALAWELRAASSLAAFLADDDRREAARLLDEVLTRSDDGSGSRDVARARVLADSLA